MSKEVDEPHIVSGCNTEIPVQPMQGMFEWLIPQAPLWLNCGAGNEAYSS